MHTKGCQAHIANLLFQDKISTKEMKPVGSKINAVLKFLRNSHASSADIQRNSMMRPATNCETRWNSYLDLMRYFKNNWAKNAHNSSSHLKHSDPLCPTTEDLSLKFVTVYVRTFNILTDIYCTKIVKNRKV